MSDALAGTGTLLRLALRRDRVRLAAWVLGIGALTAMTVSSLAEVYPTATDRAIRAELMRNPASILLGGPGYGLDDYTLGAMVANELVLTVVIAAAIMAILLTVRHTRAEEETGRAELVRAGAVGHAAPLAAALGLAAIATTAVGLVITGALVAGGLGAVDSLATGLGTGLTALAFAGVAAVAAQLTEHARAASGTALALLGVAVVVRGAGDIAEQGGSALSWLSPVAWTQQTRAFVDLRWWPLLLTAGIVAGAGALAWRLAGRRDLGAGLVRPRPGPAQASAALSGPVALAARLQRGAVLSWATGLFVLGLVLGSLGDAVAAMLADAPQFAEFLASAPGADPTETFFAATLLYVGLGAGAYAASSVLRMRGEETSGRVEPLLATALSRLHWAGAGLVVTAGAAVVLLVAGGLGMGISAAVVAGDAGLVATLAGAALAYLPAVLLVAGIAAALFGLAPRATPLVWVVVGYAVVLGMLGGLLGLPQWVLDTSPFGVTPALPGAELEAAPLVVLGALAAGLLAAGLAGIRRRDLETA
jgi:ABC-2 type transport system permease protein